MGFVRSPNSALPTFIKVMREELSEFFLDAHLGFAPCLRRN